MEERIIDDEFGKGVRLKKTKDGYVLADELDETTEPIESEETEETEEVAFEFPAFEAGEGEEDLIGLSPEEVEKKRAERAEAAAKRQAEYESFCQKGDSLFADGSYREAETEYEKALPLSDEPTEASAGYWRAKTENFTKPEALLDEYAEVGVESMEYDLGYQAVEILKKEYKEVFEREYAKLVEEETPLKESFESRQEKRRGYLTARLKKSALIFGLSFIPLIVFIILTAVYGAKIQTTPDGRFILPTVVLGVVAVACFIAVMVLANRFFNALRIYGKNERMDSTDEGERLVQIGLYKEIYEYFLEEEKTEEIE